jgi:hypothetical protein
MEFSIELMKDSTYVHKYRAGGWWRKEVSSGIWHVKEKSNHLILYSYIQDTEHLPVMVKESKNDNYLSSIIIFDNPLKLDTHTKWTLNVNGIDYPLNTNSLELDKEVVVESFHLTGHFVVEDGKYVLPVRLQDMIQSEKYKVKNTSNNMYHISFPAFVDYDIFHYKTLHDTLLIKRNQLRWNKVKLKKRQ